MTEIKEINNIELASETAYAYVDNMANQLGQEHSDYDEVEETGTFKENWQVVYDEIYDLILSKLENQ